MSTKLSHGPDQIVAYTLWAARGIGTDPTWWMTNGVADLVPGDASHDWPVFSAYEPDKPNAPDEVITVYRTSPIVDARLMVTGEQVQHHGLTVRVRARLKPTAEQKAEDVRYDFTEGKPGDNGLIDVKVTLDGQEYLVQSFQRVVVTQAFAEAPGSARWFVNVNCTAVILAYPIGR